MIKKVIVALFAAESLFGNLIKVAFFVFGLMIMPIGIVVWAMLLAHGWMLNVRRSAIQVASGMGMTTDLYIEGTEVGAMIDKARQQILFVSGYDHSIYNFADILGWEWQWLDHNGAKKDNKIVFQLRDEENPIVKVGALAASEAEHWHTRLNLILNRP